MTDMEAVDKLISMGRECVREILRDGEEKAVIVVIGTVPRLGFPRGKMLGNHTDGKPIRMYCASRFLAVVQQYLKRIENALPPKLAEGSTKS